MNTCPTCGADYRTPANFLNNPCCAKARDVAAAKTGGAITSINVPLNPEEGQEYFDKLTGQLLMFTCGKWEQLTPEQAMMLGEAKLRAGLEKTYEAVQVRMIGYIENLEGRVPSDAEFKLYGLIKTDDVDGERREVYYWRKKPVLMVRFCVREGSKVLHKIEEPGTLYPELA